MRRFALLCAASIAAGLVIPPAAHATTLPDAVEAVSVSGTVTDEATGHPVADVCVSTRKTRDVWRQWEERACTDADGQFAFELQPGRYQFQYDPRSDMYGLQWWPSADSPVEAQTVLVRGDMPVPDLDADLPLGATLSGRAIEGATGQPMDDPWIMVSAAGVEDWIANDFDASPSGRWSISGLPPGELTVIVRRADNYGRFTWAYDALTVEDAATFQLSAGETTDIGRLELIEGATLTGTVTARRSGAPIGGIEVADQDNIRSGEPTTFRGRTAADGTYRIEDVQPGSWKPVAYHYPLEEPYVPRWGFGWRDGARDPRKAVPVVLEPGGSGVVDFQLDRAARIVGTLEGFDEYANLEAILPSTVEDQRPQRVGISWDYDPDRGTFIIQGLPATRVLVEFFNAGEVGDFWYDGVRDPDDATVVRLRPGRTLHLDAHLPADG